MRKRRRARQSSRLPDEAHLLEMVIESEYLLDPLVLHHHPRATVSEGPLLVLVKLLKGFPGLFAKIPGDRLDMEDTGPRHLLDRRIERFQIQDRRLRN